MLTAVAETSKNDIVLSTMGAKQIHKKALAAEESAKAKRTAHLRRLKVY